MRFTLAGDTMVAGSQRQPVRHGSRGGTPEVVRRRAPIVASFLPASDANAAEGHAGLNARSFRADSPWKAKPGRAGISCGDQCQRPRCFARVWLKNFQRRSQVWQIFSGLSFRGGPPTRPPPPLGETGETRGDPTKSSKARITALGQFFKICFRTRRNSNVWAVGLLREPLRRSRGQ